MENIKETQDQGMAKPAFQYGLILALALILLSLVFYIAGNATSKWAGYLSYPIILGLLVLSIYKYREDVAGGVIKYGKALGFGTLVGLFCGLIYAVYSLIFYYLIGPEVINEIMLKAEETILTQNPNISMAELEIGLKMTRFFTSPIMLSIGAIFSYTFMAFVFSLIVSIFLKRKPKEEL